MQRRHRCGAPTIGKFANIAAAVRINATQPPDLQRATLHHFTYRAADYFDGAENDHDFFEWRRENRVTIGHDVWIGHGATSVARRHPSAMAQLIGAGAVVSSKDVRPLHDRNGGVPARLIPARGALRRRHSRPAWKALSWWDWDHDRLSGRARRFPGTGG